MFAHTYLSTNPSTLQYTVRAKNVFFYKQTQHVFHIAPGILVQFTSSPSFPPAFPSCRIAGTALSQPITFQFSLASVSTSCSRSPLTLSPGISVLNTFLSTILLQFTEKFKLGTTVRYIRLTPTISCDLGKADICPH